MGDLKHHVYNSLCIYNSAYVLSLSLSIVLYCCITSITYVCAKVSQLNALNMCSHGLHQQAPLLLPARIPVRHTLENGVTSGRIKSFEVFK